jgi:phosphoglycolate phosphatase
MTHYNLIFDWSGTLSDNFKSFMYVVNKFCVHFGRSPVDSDYVRDIFTIPYMKFWNKLFPDLSIDEQKILYTHFIHEAPKAELFSLARETVIQLKAKGHRIYLISSDPESKIYNEIIESGIKEQITDVVCDIHDKADAIRQLIKKHNLTLKECFYIGDSGGDIYSGKEASVNTIGVTWGFNNVRRIKEAEPGHIVTDFQELLKIF